MWHIQSAITAEKSHNSMLQKGIGRVTTSNPNLFLLEYNYPSIKLISAAKQC
jgi:hypothetical protein